MNETQLSYNSQLLPQFQRDTLVLFVVWVGRGDWREDDVEERKKNAGFKCTPEGCEIQWEPPEIISKEFIPAWERFCLPM